MSTIFEWYRAGRGDGDYYSVHDGDGNTLSPLFGPHKIAPAVMEQLLNEAYTEGILQMIKYGKPRNRTTAED